MLLRSRYSRFLKFADLVDRFCTQFFKAFYHVYLLKFRQAKFFKFMLFIVRPILSLTGVLDTKIEFFGINNDTVSAMFLARYVARKIEMRFRIQDLFTPIGKELRLLVKNTSALLGYKIQFVGRLTRRGRVRTTWVLGGSMPVSTVAVQIEHAFYLGILRNGVSCVRVWLYRHKSFGNYNYNFLYRVATH